MGGALMDRLRVREGDTVRIAQQGGEVSLPVKRDDRLPADCVRVAAAHPLTGALGDMPITYWTALIGSLALCGIPPFAGFFSKDLLIEAVHESQTPGAGIAYLAVLGGVFVTGMAMSALESRPVTSPPWNG